MKQIIFGIILDISKSGLLSCALVCKETNIIIALHVCSDEYFAKNDLGFMGIETSGRQNVEKFNKLFPEGYELVWLGRNHSYKRKNLVFNKRYLQEFKL